MRPIFLGTRGGPGGGRWVVVPAGVSAQGTSGDTAVLLNSSSSLLGLHALILSISSLLQSFILLLLPLWRLLIGLF